MCSTLFTETVTPQNEVALCCHRVRGLYLLSGNFMAALINAESINYMTLCQLCHKCLTAVNCTHKVTCTVHTNTIISNCSTLSPTASLSANLIHYFLHFSFNLLALFNS